MLRSMVRAHIMELVPRDDGPGTRLQINADLQPQFSLNHTLSLYAIEQQREYRRIVSQGLARALAEELARSCFDNCPFLSCRVGENS